MAVKVMIALNTAWNLVNFRAGLIRELVSRGYEVIAVAPSDDYAVHLPSLGCRYVPLFMDNKGTSPSRDALLLWRFWCLLRSEQPAVFLGYTVKPNLYGSLAAHFLGIPVVNNIAGLGAVFIKVNWLTRLVRSMYRVVLSRSAKVFFQNDDDRDMFVESGLVCHEIADRLPGSGVDLERFSPLTIMSTVSPCITVNPALEGIYPVRGFNAIPIKDPHLPGDVTLSSTFPESKSKPLIFLLVARMLWDKGVGEYVDAARILKRRHANVSFCLIGFLDVENPAAISRTEMDAWVTEGIVKYCGVSDDIRPWLVEADCVVLPSYREGVPRTLLEAAAMARPIVTTDAVGCRDVVKHGVNGFLCRPRDTLDLVEKLEMMMALTPSERLEMGRQGRLKVEREFDEQIVINKYLQIIEILSKKPGLYL
jgi:glycosyltransferase involved in cell wall biosynthesis